MLTNKQRNLFIESCQKAGGWFNRMRIRGQRVKIFQAIWHDKIPPSASYNPPKKPRTPRTVARSTKIGYY